MRNAHIGATFAVAMSKKRTPLWHEARLEFKMAKGQAKLDGNYNYTTATTTLPYTTPRYTTPATTATTTSRPRNYTTQLQLQLHLHLQLQMQLQLEPELDLQHRDATTPQHYIITTRQYYTNYIKRTNYTTRKLHHPTLHHTYNYTILHLYLQGQTTASTNTNTTTTTSANTLHCR